MDKYYVSQRLVRKPPNHPNNARDYEVCGLTHGGEVLIRPVFGHSSGATGVIYYGPVKQLTVEELDNRYIVM